MGCQIEVEHIGYRNNCDKILSLKILKNNIDIMCMKDVYLSLPFSKIVTENPLYLS